MSALSSLSTSTLLTANTATNTNSGTGNTTSTATSTPLSTTASSTSSSAYKLDITPAVIKAAISKTYTTQLIQSLDIDSTLSNMTMYDFYNHLSTKSLNYVVAANNDSSSTTDTTSNLSSLFNISV